MKKRFLSFFCVLTLLVPFFALAQNSFFNNLLTNVAQNTTQPEFYQFLSDSEKKLYDSLPDATKQKMIQVYNLVKAKNIQISTNGSNNSINQTSTNGNGLTSAQQSQAQNSNPYLNSNNSANPYLGRQSLWDPNSNPGNNLVYGSGVQALNPYTIGTLPKLGSGGQDCTNNHGVDGNMNGTQPSLTFTTARICQAFGRRIEVVDAKRSGACASGAHQHECGIAMDFTIRSYGDRKEQALMIVALIALGYNIGSYTENFPLHADSEVSSKWKTWSGVEHTNYQGSNARDYDLAVRDALGIIGMPANSAAEFRATYGNPPTGTMAGKARAYLQSAYGGQFPDLTAVPSI